MDVAAIDKYNVARSRYTPQAAKKNAIRDDTYVYKRGLLIACSAAIFVRDNNRGPSIGHNSFL